MSLFKTKPKDRQFIFRARKNQECEALKKANETIKQKATKGKGKKVEQVKRWRKNHPDLVRGQKKRWREKKTKGPEKNKQSGK